MMSNKTQPSVSNSSAVWLAADWWPVLVALALLIYTSILPNLPW
jgi:hypothetical protein